MGRFSWSTEQATELLREEEAAQAAFEAVLSKVREGSAAVREMITQQAELQLRMAPPVASPMAAAA